MGINVVVDEDLIKQAQSIDGNRDLEKIVAAALKEWIDRNRSPLQGMLDLVGKIKFRDDYDYKAMRLSLPRES